MSPGIVPCSQVEVGGFVPSRLDSDPDFDFNAELDQPALLGSWPIGNTLTSETKRYFRR
jgi:hypothetical protein